MDPALIEGIRTFNREVTRRLGVLGEDFLGRGRPYGEARLIFEIGTQGADVRQLRTRLGLDSGYLSRLLRSLERQGLVETRRASHDARVATATLTRKGCAELAEIDRSSDGFARTLLDALNERQRVRLVEAAADVRQLLRAASVQVAPGPVRSAAARWCLEQYFQELSQRFDTGFDPDKGRVTARPEELTPPAGYFVLATMDGNPIGCGALKLVGDCGEIKRMWVAESARGLGAGRRILESLEDTAREAGVRLLRLDSNAALKEAHNLYRSAGYVEVAAFNDNPYAHHWFEKPL